MKKAMKNAKKRMEAEVLNKLIFLIGILVLGVSIAMITAMIRGPAEPGLVSDELTMARETPRLESEVKAPRVVSDAIPRVGKEQFAKPRSQDKEIVRALPASPREEQVIARRSNFVEHLEKSGIKVKETKSLEGMNKLMAKNPQIAKNIDQEDEDTQLADSNLGYLYYAPGKIMVKQTLSDGRVQFSQIEVEEGNEEIALEELNQLPDIEAELDEVFPVNLSKVPSPTPSPSPTPTASPTPSPTPTTSPTPTPTPGAGSNDPEFPKQWALPLIEVPQAWAILREHYEEMPEVKIVIIDTGADLNHPDLKEHIDASLDKDFVNKDDEAQDDNGHGTHVAGIMGAVINNGTGIAGVTLNPKLIIIKALDAQGNQVSASVLAESLSYAINSGAKIINMSWGSYRNLMRNKTLRAVFRAAFAKDILLVAAAGNHGEPGLNGEDPVLYPARYRKVLAVGATNKIDDLWWSEDRDETGSSNPLDEDYNPWFGQNYETARGPKVEIYAPGGDESEDIYSTIRGGYGYQAGTSMAAAFVSGVAGLILTADADLDKDELRAQLIKTADLINHGDEEPFWLRVNALNALEGLLPAEDEIWIKGRVEDGQGKPVEGMAVRVVYAGEDFAFEAGTETDEQGRYFISLSAEELGEEDIYELEVSPEDQIYEPVTIEAILGELHRVDFVPEAGQEDVIIIKGRVMDRSCYPVAEATVRAKSRDLYDDITVETDNSGRYRMEIGIEEFKEDKNVYEVAVDVPSRSEYKPQTIKASLAKVHIVNFDLSEGRCLPPPSKGTAIVYGRVTAGLTGEALAEARVTASLSDAYPYPLYPERYLPGRYPPGRIVAETYTDDNGEYELRISFPIALPLPDSSLDHPETNIFYITASKEGVGVKTERVELKAGDKKEVNFVLIRIEPPDICQRFPHLCYGKTGKKNIIER
jgi:protocatechuate 3,4-dioxygenase beta subunit